MLVSYLKTKDGIPNINIKMFIRFRLLASLFNPKPLQHKVFAFISP